MQLVHLPNRLPPSSERKLMRLVNGNAQPQKMSFNDITGTLRERKSESELQRETEAFKARNGEQ